MNKEVFPENEYVDKIRESWDDFIKNDPNVKASVQSIFSNYESDYSRERDLQLISKLMRVY